MSASFIKLLLNAGGDTARLAGRNADFIAAHGDELYKALRAGEQIKFLDNLLATQSLKLTDDARAFATHDSVRKLLSDFAGNPKFTEALREAHNAAVRSGKRLDDDDLQALIKKTSPSGELKERAFMLQSGINGDIRALPGTRTNRLMMTKAKIAAIPVALVGTWISFELFGDGAISKRLPGLAVSIESALREYGYENLANQVKEHGLKGFEFLSEVSDLDRTALVNVMSGYLEEKGEFETARVVRITNALLGINSFLHVYNAGEGNRAGATVDLICEKADVTREQFEEFLLKRPDKVNMLRSFGVDFTETLPGLAAIEPPPAAEQASLREQLGHAAAGTGAALGAVSAEISENAASITQPIKSGFDFSITALLWEAVVKIYDWICEALDLRPAFNKSAGRGAHHLERGSTNKPGISGQFDTAEIGTHAVPTRLRLQPEQGPQPDFRPDGLDHE